MPKEIFKVVETETIYKAEDMAATLSKLDNLSDPYKGADRCPYTDGQKCPKFLGFGTSNWSTTPTNGGTYLVLKFEGIPSVALKSFLKSSEEALDAEGNEKHIENADEGIAKIMRQHNELGLALFKAIAQFFESGEHEFRITKFKIKTTYGKKPRHLINIV
jgi:hypothetical protein